MFPLKIIFQDDCLMVIDKSAGLVVTPSETQHETTLSEILRDEYGIDIERGGVVHRLDKDTSGLILAAKNLETFESLQSQFKSRTVKKEYLALVHGILNEEKTVKGAIMRNPGNREKFIVGEEGREAETVFRPISNYELGIKNYELLFGDLNKNQKRRIERSNYGVFTLVRCFPLTGRTHQIRVHLKYIDHPIVGDSKYAGRKTARQDAKWCKRQFLHAAKIAFDHPVTGERLEFESPLPDDLAESLSKLEQND